MTELTTYQPSTEVADYQSNAVHRLGEWAASASAAFKVAAQLVETAFVPQAFRGKPMEATAAILAGTEVGLSPMAALRAFDIIQGQAAPRAITLRAIVQSYGHQMILIESTATRCRMKGLRKGDGEWQSVTWTLDRAKDLGLLGKDNWKKQPAAMLVARATSELARLIASDAILGIGYSVEEIADGGTPAQTVETETLTPTQTGTRRMSRASSRVAAGPPAGAESGEESGFESQPAPATTEALEEERADTRPEPDGITDAQMKMLHASFNDAGITDRDQRLAYCTNLIGRQLTSSKDLTKAEASRVIDALVEDAGAQPVEPGLFPEGGAE